MVSLLHRPSGKIDEEMDEELMESILKGIQSSGSKMLRAERAR